MLQTGVYSIRNTVNGKRYVGSTARSFAVRWSNHRAELNRGKYHGPHFQSAWKKYGDGTFAFEVLFPCGPDLCVAMEQRFIDLLQPKYNVRPVAGNGAAKGNQYRLGHKHTAEAREKMSAANRGRKLSPGIRARMSLAHMGHRPTPETRAKLSAAHKGKHPSAETRAKMSVAAMGNKNYLGGGQQ